MFHALQRVYRGGLFLLGDSAAAAPGGCARQRDVDFEKSEVPPEEFGIPRLESRLQNSGDRPNKVPSQRHEEHKEATKER